VARIDVTELLTDPDFADTFTLVRTAQSVDDHGRSVFTETPYLLVGVVQSASGRSLEYLPDMSRASGAIEVYCKFYMQVASDGYAADRVQWNGKTYIVTHIDDWTNYGSGFTRALCILQPLTGP
jgi:galactose-6-phosphate isomerase